MEKYSCIIVEDEPLAAEILVDYVKQVAFLELKSVCTDAIFAMDVLKKEKIDVVFLDIHLPKIKGLDFIKTLKYSPEVIITTAYRNYAIESYELNVLDYLMKPINFNRFLTAVNKIKTRGNHTNKETTDAPDRKHLYINVNKKMVKIYFDEILFIESKKEYVSIVTKKSAFSTKLQLGEIEALLSASNFLRVHRSFIVSKSKIVAFTATEIEIKDKVIPIGRSYKETVSFQLLE